MPNTIKRKKSSFSDSKSNHSGTMSRNKSRCSMKKEKSQGSANSTFISTQAFSISKDHQVGGDQKIASLSHDILPSNVTSLLSPERSLLLTPNPNRSVFSYISNKSLYSPIDSNKSGYSHNTDANQDAASQQVCVMS